MCCTQMTNHSLRERFGLPEGSDNTILQIITATVELGLVKSDPDEPDSRRDAWYIPAWG
jgi:ATP-dependent DNA helicase RecG